MNFLKIRSGISSTGLPETASRQVISIQNVMEKGNTRTVIQAKIGNIFMGFAVLEWRSTDKIFTDPKVFIISLINKEENPFKVKCSRNGLGALYCSSEFGPSFGEDINMICLIQI